MKDMSLNKYLILDNKMKSQNTKKHFQKKIKIALLGSFTLNGFKEVLNVKCHELDIEASCHVTAYDQYTKELIDENSDFYKFKPDITFLLIDTKSLFGDIYFNPYYSSEIKRRNTIKNNYEKLNALVKNFIKFGTGILVINNFEVPTYSPRGILEGKEKFGYFDMVSELNQQVSRFNEHKSVFVFNYDSFVSGIGKKNIADNKLLYLADMLMAPGIIPVLCEEYMRYVKALKGIIRKCIVFDMDNVLWGGIVGEDGPDGIKLGPSPPGNAYVEFQKHILALFHRGIILAVNSSNNEDDAINVLRKHPYMVLKEQHFASIKINWKNKVDNLSEIAKDLNVGLDSMVYIDDDKRNCQVVREALPDILCPDLPEDVAHYSTFLMNLKGLDSLQITEEDMKRGAMYAFEKRRKDSKNVFNDISKYLKHLEIVVEIKPADKFAIPRLSQLSLRTNQFNFSTKRYDEKTIGKLVSDKKKDVYCINVKDVYGDYGTTGAVVICKDNSGWVIDTFLMSCRVLGRNVEDAVLSNIVEKAIKNNVNEIRINFKKTKKNTSIISKFLKQNGIMDKRETITLYKKGQKTQLINKINHIKVL